MLREDQFIFVESRQAKLFATLGTENVVALIAVVEFKSSTAIRTTHHEAGSVFATPIVECFPQPICRCVVIVDFRHPLTSNGRSGLSGAAFRRVVLVEQDVLIAPE